MCQFYVPVEFSLVFEHPSIKIIIAKTPFFAKIKGPPTADRATPYLIKNAYGVRATPYFFLPEIPLC